MNNMLNGQEIILFARSIAPSLGKKEKKIINFISNNYGEIPNLTITSLSKKLDISEATITKACKKLRCDGFHKLKQLIAAFLKEKNSFEVEVEDDFSSFDNNELIVEKVFTNSIIAIQNTLSFLNMEQFNKAIEAINKSSKNSKIMLVGSGGSGILCEDFQHKLLKVGIIAVFFQDSNMQLMSSALVDNHDLVIGISHSGKSRNTIKALKIARFHGAKTICITNHAISPISTIAEISLCSAAKNSPLTGENAAARIAQLNILDALYTALVVHYNNTSFTNLEKTKKSIR